MPLSAPRPCNLPGCPRYAERRGYCVEHATERRRHADAERLSAPKRGYDRTWASARASYLRRNPLCTSDEHRGRAIPATVVDHVVPISEAPALRLVESNFRSLCKRCHDSRTARDQGFGRRRAQTLNENENENGSHLRLW